MDECLEKYHVFKLIYRQMLNLQFLNDNTICLEEEKVEILMEVIWLYTIINNKRSQGRFDIDNDSTSSNAQAIRK